MKQRERAREQPEQHELHGMTNARHDQTRPLTWPMTRLSDSSLPMRSEPTLALKAKTSLLPPQNVSRSGPA